MMNKRQLNVRFAGALLIVVTAIGAITACTKQPVTPTEPCQTHSYDEGVVSKKATCKEEGVLTYTCTVCKETKTESIPLSGHAYDDGKITQKPTLNEKGTKLYTCKVCGGVKKETLDKLPAAYTITMAGLGELNLPEDGIYELQDPEKIGFEFLGWVDADGNHFPSKGTVSSDVTVRAMWKLLDTTTLDELEERAAGGAEEICIVNDLVIDRPIFFTGETRLYASGNVTLSRHKSYTGELFVVGCDKDGNSSVLLNKQAVLTLGGKGGTLTLDGNRDAMDAKVVGSAIFMSDSATVNIYDGAVIANHQKLGNERSQICKDYLSEVATTRAGGAAIAIMNGTVNMYGGIIENNAVATAPTIVDNGDGSVSAFEDAGCGGAIYNMGGFYMYGGTIRNNEALRGGGIYNGGTVRLEAGTVAGNLTHTYGGAFATSSEERALTFIGTDTADAEDMMIFESNHALKVGGALYSYTNSSIVILGNTQFKQNTAGENGGAIYTAGGLTVNDATFENNSCPGSGGAIYYFYAKADRAPRHLDLTNCTLTGNTAKSGGAIMLSASSSVADTGKGAITAITDCSFTANCSTADEGGGNGGAIYVTRKADITIKRSSFTQNSAKQHGGALYMLGSKVTLDENISFIGNTAGRFGGAVFIGEHVATTTDANGETNQVITKSTVSVKNTNFDGNVASGRGGALYVSKNEYTLTNTVFENNRAEEDAYGGGAIYCSESTGTLDDVTFTNNTSHKGGAVALHSGSAMTISSMTATGNSATANAEGTHGTGGVFYINSSTLSLVEGACKSIVIGGEGNLANTATTGGAIHMQTNSVLNITGAEIKGNASTFAQAPGEYNSDKGGGAIYSLNSTVNLSGVTLQGNKTEYYGGAVMVLGGTANISDSTVTENVGGTGAALFFKSKCEAQITNTSITGHAATANGTVYANKAKLTLNNVTATGNSANCGGVLYVSGDVSEITLVGGHFTGNTATSKGGALYADAVTLRVNQSTFSENGANLGGAIYATGSNALACDGATFEKNSSASHGGAIDLVATKATFTGDNRFSENTAGGHGGAIYVTYTTLEDETALGSSLSMTIGTFEDNTALGGGAVSIRSHSAATFNGTSFEGNSITVPDGAVNDGDGESGGAIYVGYGELTLTDCVLTGNQAPDGFGGAVNSIHSTVNVAGGRLTGNSNGIYAHSGTLNVRGNVTVKDNTDSDVYLTSKLLITVNGALGTDASIGVNAPVGVAFAKPDGVNVTDLSDYADRFFNMSGDPAYVNLDGQLAIGFLIIDQPMSMNGYTVRVSGSPAYQWYVWENGELTALDGQTSNVLTSPVVGQTYVCTATRGNTTLITDPVTYYTTKSHAVCGLTCDHAGDATHGVVEWLPISNVSELTAAAKRGGYYYLATDLALSKSITVSADFTLCMGGKTLSAAQTETEFSMLRVGEGAVLTLTDCSDVERVGYIDPTTGLWTEGTYEGDGEAVSYTLYGGVIMGGHASNGGAIYANGGIINIYNVNFAGNAASSDSGAIHLSNPATLYLHDVSFVGNVAQNQGGAIEIGGATLRADGDNVFAYNTSTDHGGALHVSYKTVNEVRVGGTVTMTGGRFIGNTAMGGGAVSIRTSCAATFNGTEFDGNVTAGYAGEFDGDGECGGAIYVGYGELNLTDCVLTDNTATDGFGGAVNVVGSTVNVTGGSFTGNTADKGGAIHNSGSSTVSVNGTTFAGNTATDGGALYGNKGTVTVTGATFTENTASNHGGAIYVNKTVLTCIDSTFTGNTAVNNAGAIYVINSTEFGLDGCTFTQNTAKLGGALYIHGSTFACADSTFKQNSATNNAGAIDIVASTATLTGDNLFEANTAANHGGAVYVSYSGDVTGTLRMTDGRFIDNTAMGGGAVSIRTGCEATFEGTSFQGNTVSGYAGEFDGNGECGGAIYVGFGALTLKNATFTENASTDGFGGAVNSLDSTVTVTGGSFTGNTADKGGAIYGNNGSAISVSGVTFTQNTAIEGGAIHAKSSSVTVSDSSFASNTASSQGAAIYASDATLSCTNTTLDQNTAANNGGAVYAINSESISLSGCTFTKNTSKLGGAIYVNSSTFACVDSTFKQNSASNHGGAIDIVATNATFTGNNLFEANTATNHGGAIYVTYTGEPAVGSTLEMTGGQFKQNSAIAGGAVSGRTHSVMSFNGVTFLENAATATATSNPGGGAIHVNNGELTVTGCTFDGNTSGYYGGAITGDVSTVTLNGGTTVRNSRGKTGAALYFKGAGTVIMDTVTLENNGTGTNGVVYFNGGTNTLTNVTATGNTADKGGVFYISGGSTTIRNSTLDGNFATTQGGAISISGGSTKVTVENTVMTNNGMKLDPESSQVVDYTNNGGAIYVATNNGLTLTGCTITGNGAGYGGGLYANTGVTYTIDASTTENVTDNTAEHAGTENLYTKA